jgi:hypothetical protein
LALILEIDQVAAFSAGKMILVAFLAVNRTQKAGVMSILSQHWPLRQPPLAEKCVTYVYWRENRWMRAPFLS